MVARTDVDPHLVEAGRFAAILLFQEMGSLLADDADDVSIPCGDAEPLPDDDLFVPSNEAGEPEEALLVDVSDHEADRVDVAREQHCGGVRRISARLDSRERAPDNVVSY